MRFEARAATTAYYAGRVIVENSRGDDFVISPQHARELAAELIAAAHMADDYNCKKVTPNPDVTGLNEGGK